MILNRFRVQSVLLADDDADDRLVFSDVIREIHPKVHLETVPGGVQLLKLLEHFAPDLLFLDLEMPFKNGLECLSEIRNNQRLATLPVVVFSSTTRPANIQTAYEMGANLFLIKESTFNQYSAALTTILSLEWKEPEKIKAQYCINGRYAAFS